MSTPSAVPVIGVRLAGFYDFTQIERAIRDLVPLITLTSPRRIQLDLTGLAFIGPTALALLEATLRRLEENELMAPGTAILLPRSPMTANYLHRMDLFRGMKTVGEIEEPFKRREAVGFRPCQQFATATDYVKVARELTDALVERCRTDSLARSAIYICMNELTENVIHHADSPFGGVAAAQGNPKAARFEIGIADLGVGIRGSLSKNPRYADIADDVEPSKPRFSQGLRRRLIATPASASLSPSFSFTRMAAACSSGLGQARSLVESVRRPRRRL